MNVGAFPFGQQLIKSNHDVMSECNAAALDEDPKVIAWVL